MGDIALRLADYFNRKQNKADVQAVMEHYCSAWLSMEGRVASSLVTHMLTSVYGRLREFGMTEKAEFVEIELRRIANHIDEDFATVEVETKIPRENIEACIDRLTDGSADDVLRRIAGTFVPPIDDIRKRMKTAPLEWSLFSKFFDEVGRRFAPIGPVDVDPDGNLVYGISQECEFYAPFLAMAFGRAKERLALFSDVVRDWVLQSPLFRGREKFLRIGIDAWMNGQHIVAAHVLVPQIEAALRSMVDGVGGSTWRPDRTGALNYRSLDDLLRNDQLKKELDSDVVLYFRVLLTDLRGWNLRNKVCHGLLPPEKFGSGMTDRLIHVLLILGLIREKSSEHGDVDASH